MYNDPDNPCALKCKAKGSGLVMELAPKVLDGTRCYTESLDMCISGVCQVIETITRIFMFGHLHHFGVPRQQSEKIKKCDSDPFLLRESEKCIRVQSHKGALCWIKSNQRFCVTNRNCETKFFCCLSFSPSFLQIVGCDHELGSTAKEDNCGVCNGDGSSCRLVRGHYKSQHASGKSKESLLGRFFSLSQDEFF